MADLIGVERPPQIVVLAPMALADVWVDIRTVARSSGCARSGRVTRRLAAKRTRRNSRGLHRQARNLPSRASNGSTR